MKKIMTVLFLMVSFCIYAEEDIIGDILRNGFGVELRVGLVSFGSPDKFTIKAFNGDIEIVTENKIVVIEADETFEVYYSDGQIKIDGEYYGNAEIIKMDVVASIGLSADNTKFRTYRGSIEIVPDFEKKCLVMVNKVLAEEYLYSVVACEIDSNFGEEAIKAQAVAARTYLYSSLSIGKHKGYDVVDTTADQVYKGITSEKEIINKLVNETEDEIITYDDEPITAYYHQNSGGKTANIEDVWIGSKPIPYLKAVFDVDNSEALYKGAWKYKISKADLSRAFNFNVDKITINEMRDGRVYKATVDGKVFSGNELRKIVGYTNLPSTMFEVKNEWNDIVFIGKGGGHGIGMSQTGTAELDKRGYKYPEILKYYYTGIEIKSIEKTKKYDIIKKGLLAAK